MSYNITKAKKAIRNKWDWKNPDMNITTFIWGPIGVGKTNAVEQLVIERKIAELEAKILLGSDSKLTDLNKLRKLQDYTFTREIQDILDENLLVLRLAERPIEQLQGIPAPILENNSAKFLIPENLTKLQESSWVVVFIDELDKADESKMTAATHLVESRRIGDFLLPKDTFIVCAGNRVEDSWISRTVVPELKNRGAHIEIEPDLDEWLLWADNNNIREDIKFFLRYKQSLRENYLAKYDETANAFPTPRTWHFSSVQLNRLEPDMDKTNPDWQNELFDELGQFVGESTAAEFKAYIVLYRNIDIIALLDGQAHIPKSINEDVKTISKQYVYAFAICDQITPELLEKPTRLDNFVKIIASMQEEIKTVLLSTLCFSHDDIIDILSNHSEGIKLTDRFLDSIDESKN